MLICSIDLPDHLNDFIDELVRTGRHSSPDEVVVAALERYAQDVATELGLVALIDKGDFDKAALRTFILQYRHSHSMSLLPVTPELLERIEKLVGPISEISIDPDEPIHGDTNL